MFLNKGKKLDEVHNKIKNFSNLFFNMYILQYETFILKYLYLYNITYCV